MESQELGVDFRVTTDATHRRFKNKEFYLCTQCDEKLPKCKEELKSHFENVKHKGDIVCESCSKPGFAYLNNKKTEFYHNCQSH